MKYTLCGNKAPNITLPDLDQENWVKLHDIEAKYTLICIWESTCGHCKKEMPKLERIYDESGIREALKFLPLATTSNPNLGQEYIREKELTKWVNVSDNPLINAQDSATALIYGGVTNLESLNFRTTFDVYATPKMFLARRRQKHRGQASNGRRPTRRKSCRKWRGLRRPCPTARPTKRRRARRTTTLRKVEIIRIA